MNFKDIHIGKMLEQSVAENGIETALICGSFNCTEEQIRQMYHQKSFDTDDLLIWSKLLQYDFFRIYTQHMIFYAPPSAKQEVKKSNAKTSSLGFRKNIYTREVIDFILEQIYTGEMSKNEVIERYRIPKTTLYKWIEKYKNQEI